MTSQTKDTITYNYVPLYPSVKNRDNPIHIKVMNQRQFLIIKNGKEFQRAIYISKSTNNDRPMGDKFSLTNFSGSLLLQYIYLGYCSDGTRHLSFTDGAGIVGKGSCN